MPPLAPPALPTPLWLTLAVIMAAAAAGDERGGDGGSSGARCGGVLTDPRGVLATPNFPGPPPVPLHCHWVINASWVKDGNITVYLTQQYVLRGLVFYVKNFAVNGDSVEEVLYSAEDSSVLEPTYYVRSHRQAVFVNLTLPRLDGNHLRVLQGLRDVYGFNITYEVTVNGEPGRPSCTPMSCSGVGHCLANHNFTNFSCECPKDYFGVNCSSGPMCANKPCRNGGTCKVAGTDSIVCDCRGTNYSGVFCQYPPIPVEIGECKTNDEFCDCTSGPHIVPVRRRYTATFSTLKTGRTVSRRLTKDSWDKTSFISLTSSDDDELRFNLRKFARILDKAVSSSMARRRLQKIYDFNITNVTSDGNISFEFLSEERNEIEVKKALASLMRASWGLSVSLSGVQGTAFSDSPFNSNSVESTPVFYLEKVLSNDNGVEYLRPGSQVVFSCFTVGSSNVSFSWYKEGYLVTPGITDRIWTEILRDGDRITSLLCVERLTALDAGRWTCKARDELQASHRSPQAHRVQQCRSLDFNVQQEPIVRMQPLAVSATKGDAVFLSCLASNDDGDDEFQHSWSRDGIPFKSEGDHVWELLEYPRGSLLRLQNVSVSSTYTCHVTSKLVNTSVSARVEVLTEETPRCDGDEEWPVMPAGTLAIVDCPEGRDGSLATRECVWRGRENKRDASWNEPDFSACLFDELVPLEDDLREISLGYSPSTPRKILFRLLDVLRNRSAIRPHQGEAILPLAMGAWRRSGDRLENHQLMSEIIDLLLSFPRALASPKVLRDLVNVTLKAAVAQTESSDVVDSKIFYRNLVILGLRPNMSEVVARFEENHLRWLAPVCVRIPNSFFQKSLAIVQFRSLEDIIPYRSRINGSNGAYRVLSTIVKSSVSNTFQPGGNPVSRPSVELAEGFEIVATFRDLVVDLPTLFDASQTEFQYWNLTCAYARNLMDPWDLSSCKTLVAKDQEGFPRSWIPWRRAVAFVSTRNKVSVQCICRTPGAYAVLLARFTHKSDGGVPSVAVVLALWCCALEAAAAVVLPFVFAARGAGEKSTPATTPTSDAQAEAQTPAPRDGTIPVSPPGDARVTAPEIADNEPATAMAFRVTSCINTALVAVIMASTMYKWDTVLPAVLLQCLLLLGISLPTAQLYLVAVELGTFPFFSVSSLWSRQCSRLHATAIALAIVPVVVVLALWLSSRDVRGTLSQCWSSWLNWEEPACWAIALPSSLVAVGGVLLATASRRLSSFRAYTRRVNSYPRCGSVVRLCAILVCQLAFLLSAVLYTSVPGLATQVAFIFASCLLGYSLLLCYVLRLEKQWPVLLTPKCCGEAADEGPPPRCSTSTTATDCECESRWLPKILRRGPPNGETPRRFSAFKPPVTSVALSSFPPSPASEAPSLTVESPDSLRPLIGSSEAIRACPDATPVCPTTNGLAKKAPVRAVSRPRQLLFPSQSQQSVCSSKEEPESSLFSPQAPSSTCTKINNGYLYMRSIGTTEECTVDVHRFLGGGKAKWTERRKSEPQVSIQAPPTPPHCQPRRCSQGAQYEFRRMFLRLDDIEEAGPTGS